MRAHNNYLILGFLLLSFLGLNAQLGFSSVDEIINSLKSQPSDEALHAFLKENHFVEPWFWKKYIEHSGEDTLMFHVGSFEIDVFRKNLFGSEKDEVIIQLREGPWRLVSIFYSNENRLLKVPGQITNLNELKLTYLDQKFIFYFEDIVKADEFCILAKNSYSAEYGNYQWLEIYQVRPDTILSVLKLQAGYHSTPKAAPSVVKKVVEYEFRLGDSYPMLLTWRESSVELRGLQLSSDGDTLNGTRIIKNKIIDWRFALEEGKLHYHQSDSRSRRRTYYLSQACKQE